MKRWYVGQYEGGNPDHTELVLGLRLGRVRLGLVLPLSFNVAHIRTALLSKWWSRHARNIQSMNQSIKSPITKSSELSERDFLIRMLYGLLLTF